MAGAPNTQFQDSSFRRQCEKVGGLDGSRWKGRRPVTMPVRPATQHGIQW